MKMHAVECDEERRERNVRIVTGWDDTKGTEECERTSGG